MSLKFKTLFLALHCPALCWTPQHALSLPGSEYNAPPARRFISQAAFQDFSSAIGEGREAPALFVKLQEEYCFIPISRGDFQRHEKKGNIRRAGSYPESLEYPQGLIKLCPEAASHAALLAPKEAAALSASFVVGAVIYAGLCAFAHYAEDKPKRAKAPLIDDVLAVMRIAADVGCAPIYIAGDLFQRLQK